MNKVVKPTKSNTSVAWALLALIIIPINLYFIFHLFIIIVVFANIIIFSSYSFSSSFSILLLHCIPTLLSRSSLHPIIAYSISVILALLALFALCVLFVLYLHFHIFYLSICFKVRLIVIFMISPFFIHYFT